mmetsp:Transcript_13111/g.34292  ORF Transcript_13111/g.34292 Transcript_13111/m.34292 type:complete len:97 (+) Transcript_13111:1183-1473(+)
MGLFFLFLPPLPFSPPPSLLFLTLLVYIDFCCSPHCTAPRHTCAYTHTHTHITALLALTHTAALHIMGCRVYQSILTGTPTLPFSTFFHHMMTIRT